MGATSIHVQAVKPGSEIHNFREKELDYVRPELSHLNESWVGDSISHRLESAKQRYFDTVGQKMQTKAAPIREGVIVIKQETTMQELQQFAAVCKERFGIEAFQIHIHKDEGYMNAKQWTPNLHAHVVFDWTQPNGKSVRLSRDDMAELQTIASEALGMERGVSSDRKHLSAMQYKTECAKEQLQELANDISSALDKHKDVQNQLLQLQKELRSIETKKNVQKLISKASEKFYGLIGKTVNDREKDALKAKIKALEGENEQLSDRLGKAILEKERNGTKVFKAENDKEYYRQQMDNAVYNMRSSSLWVRDGSYLKLKNVTIGYNFTDKKMLKKLGIQQLGIKLTGYNLLTFDKFDIMDPECNPNNADSYPIIKIYNLGINLTF